MVFARGTVVARTPRDVARQADTSRNENHRIPAENDTYRYAASLVITTGLRFDSRWR